MHPINFIELPELEKLLVGIEKPGRYIDKEFGTKSKSLDLVIKDPGLVLSALIFPDIYEIGMSNLGIQVLYSAINDYAGFSAERVFSPWVDFEKRLREKKVKLFSLENRITLDCFDLIGFSAAHEMLYTNILNIIDLAGLKVRSSDRKGIFPIICSGGPAAVNPWPLAKFIDFFVVGDGEGIIIDILDKIKDFKKNYLLNEKKVRKDHLLEQLSHIEGVFVPDLYKINYKPDGTISNIEPGKVIKKAVFKDFKSYPVIKEPIVPNISVVHDRLNIEIMRGCRRSCRFCQAGFIYRPVRRRPVEKLVSDSIEGLKNTGYDEISFTSLSSSDYKDINRLIELLSSIPEFEHISTSLPSLRLDSFSFEIIEKINTGRKTGLTFAPEAGSQRLRDIIKKDISEKNLFDTMKLVFSKGWHRVKLYFMIGLPFEEEDDIDCIVELIKKIVGLARDMLPGKIIGRFQLIVSINGFCPKPFTPFQWCGQENKTKLSKKFESISEKIPAKFVKLNYMSPEKSEIECAMARGDSRVSDAIEKAWMAGARFDNWTDYFDYNLWIKAFKESGLDIKSYTTRNIGIDEILPWDIIDIGIRKAFFIAEYEKARKDSLKNLQG